MGPMRLYACLLACLLACADQVLHQSHVCNTTFPTKKHGGSFTRSKVGLSRRPTTVHRGLGLAGGLGRRPSMFAEFISNNTVSCKPIRVCFL